MVLISSQIRNDPPLISALATQKRCNSPPDSSRGNRSSQAGSMPKAASISGRSSPLSSSTRFSRHRGLMALSGC